MYQGISFKYYKNKKSKIGISITQPDAINVEMAESEIQKYPPLLITSSVFLTSCRLYKIM